MNRRGETSAPTVNGSKTTRIRSNETQTAAEPTADCSGQEELNERRALRSRYLHVKALISDKRDDISNVDSDNFDSIINEVENLHKRVRKPREQVADAEALLDIANTLVSSVRAQSNEGITPSDFVNSLLRNFEQSNGEGTSADAGRSSIAWKNIASGVAHIFRKAPECCTMLGPMTNELKLRKPIVQKKRVRPTESARPEELNAANKEERTGTDMNMATMFNILRKNKKAGLENLVLNRNSFAQTVENIFALSFLVKDGRAEIVVNEGGKHIVSPRNAPAANAVTSKEVSYFHFVFRYDFRDWKLMVESVGVGDELMPHRNPNDTDIDCGVWRETENSMPGQTTPIRKLSRNRGLVLQEQSVVAESPESDDNAERAVAIRRGKRKIG
ncbi:non-structural maintenance of chromosomes element 4 homolog A [Impatiens glandulifera]|uniref:non-structural maintenance of chromosomes element 4 homolog A n=1 Tax=Impatiens glandulifera TaxID=253017 RepID=UPI001FB0CA12|nr:non-structural maintenance of chromosomes element 4 homolog A [Impatiens glandulifera]